MVVLLGAALALMLAAACGSDSTGNGSPANITEFLTSAGGYSAAAALLESGSIENTGIWVNGTGKATGDPDLGIINLGVEALADKVSEARSMATEAIEAIEAIGAIGTPAAPGQEAIEAIGAIGAIGTPAAPGQELSLIHI